MQSADVGMIQSRDGSRLAVKPLRKFFVRDLDRDTAVEPRIRGAEYLSHASSAQYSFQFVGSELRSDAYWDLDRLRCLGGRWMAGTLWVLFQQALNELPK